MRVVFFNIWLSWRDTCELSTQSRNKAKRYRARRYREGGASRRRSVIAPTVPIDQLNLSHKPKQLECFSPVKASQAEDCERHVQVEKRPITPLVDAIRQHAKEEGLSMCFLAFFEPSSAPSPAPVQCPYNARRVKPLRFPERFSLLLSEQEAYTAQTHHLTTRPFNPGRHSSSAACTMLIWTA